MTLPNSKDRTVLDFVRAMPKAELHIHIEGSLEPELIFTMAQRNHITLPYTDINQLRQAYAFKDLQSFLDIYYAGAGVLITEADFFDMAWAYFLRAKADNIIHTELFFDPQTHTERGVSFSTVINGLQKAIQQAKTELGITAELILCFLRHLSEEAAFETFEQARPHMGQFIGVGLDSSELGHPPEKFTRVFAEARKHGLRTVAHAGEEGPPAYIWSALENLKAERIDHGVQALRDSSLVTHLATQRIPLTVCPLSNIKLCVFKNLREHNLTQLLDLGLLATINSDDPAYFGGYLNQNFTETFTALNLTLDHAKTLARNSFEASFASTRQKQGYQDRLSEYVAQQSST
jgi:adenosine deaminase